MFESFIGIDFWTALFILLNTLAIFLVARKYLIGPVRKLIESRQKEIDDMYETASNAKEDAMAMKEEYLKKLNDAQMTSDKIVKDAVARGQKREEEIVEKAKNEAGQILQKAQDDIQLEKKKAVNEAKNEISDMALEIAGKVVGRQLSAADKAEMIDHFIDELGDIK
ncbi:MAG: F0F1 ATP synthase subunit B [Clostridia bacterium]|nr:F0F1 ATP synthase subunit B [Clostridia bacterium]MBQ4618637.1 F0F1 ATP synthase subunit B [Clostridia bacterium]